MSIAKNTKKKLPEPRHTTAAIPYCRIHYFVGLVEKADTSIFRWKSRHVDFSLEKPTRRAWIFFPIKKTIW